MEKLFRAFFSPDCFSRIKADFNCRYPRGRRRKNYFSKTIFFVAENPPAVSLEM